MRTEECPICRETFRGKEGCLVGWGKEDRSDVGVGWCGANEIGVT